MARKRIQPAATPPVPPAAPVVQAPVPAPPAPAPVPGERMPDGGFSGGPGDNMPLRPARLVEPHAVTYPNQPGGLKPSPPKPSLQGMSDAWTPFPGNPAMEQSHRFMPQAPMSANDITSRMTGFKRPLAPPNAAGTVDSFQPPPAAPVVPGRGVQVYQGVPPRTQLPAPAPAPAVPQLTNSPTPPLPTLPPSTPPAAPPQSQGQLTNNPTLPRVNVAQVPPPAGPLGGVGQNRSGASLWPYGALTGDPPVPAPTATGLATPGGPSGLQTRGQQFAQGLYQPAPPTTPPVTGSQATEALFPTPPPPPPPPPPPAPAPVPPSQGAFAGRGPVAGPGRSGPVPTVSQIRAPTPAAPLSAQVRSAAGAAGRAAGAIPRTIGAGVRAADQVAGNLAARAPGAAMRGLRTAGPMLALEAAADPLAVAGAARHPIDAATGMVGSAVDGLAGLGDGRFRAGLGQLATNPDARATAFRQAPVLGAGIRAVENMAGGAGTWFQNPRQGLEDFGKGMDRIGTTLFGGGESPAPVAPAAPTPTPPRPQTADELNASYNAAGFGPGEKASGPPPAKAPAAPAVKAPAAPTVAASGPGLRSVGTKAPAAPRDPVREGLMESFANAREQASFSARNGGGFVNGSDGGAWTRSVQDLAKQIQAHDAHAADMAMNPQRQSLMAAQAKKAGHDAMSPGEQISSIGSDRESIAKFGVAKGLRGKELQDFVGAMTRAGQGASVGGPVDEGTADAEFTNNPMLGSIAPHLAANSATPIETVLGMANELPGGLDPNSPVGSAIATGLRRRFPGQAYESMYKGLGPTVNPGTSLLSSVIGNNGASRLVNSALGWTQNLNPFNQNHGAAVTPNWYDDYSRGQQYRRMLHQLGFPQMQ